MPDGPPHSSAPNVASDIVQGAGHRCRTSATSAAPAPCPRADRRTASQRIQLSGGVPPSSSPPITLPDLSRTHSADPCAMLFLSVTSNIGIAPNSGSTSRSDVEQWRDVGKSCGNDGWLHGQVVKPARARVKFLALFAGHRNPARGIAGRKAFVGAFIYDVAFFRARRPRRFGRRNAARLQCCRLSGGFAFGCH